MDIVLPIIVAIIAFLAGVGGAYGLLENRLNIQEKRHRSRTRRELEEAERVYADRLQVRLDALKAQYETQIQQLKVELQTSKSIAFRPASDAPSPSTNLPSSTPAKRPLPMPDEDVTILETATIAEAARRSQMAATSLEEEDLTVIEPSLASQIAPATLSTPPQTPSAETTHSFQMVDLERLANTTETAARLSQTQALLAALESSYRVDIPQKSLIQTLKPLSKHRDPQLRIAVIRCFARLSSPLVLPILREALRDVEPDVVKAAQDALTPWRSHSPKKPQGTKKKTAKSKSMG